MNAAKLALIVGAGVILVGGLTVSNSALALGVRANNPLNIKYSTSNNWVGQTGFITDDEGHRFSTFSDAQYCYRAGAIILRRYQAGYHLTTVRQMMGRWAQNDGRAVADNYAETVASVAGVDPDDTIDVVADDVLLTKILQGMSRMEIGELESLAFIGSAGDGVAMA